MVKVKTSELTGAALDWAVGEALKPHLNNPDWLLRIATFGPLFGRGYRWPTFGMRKFTPSTDWRDGGFIIARWKIAVLPPIVRRISAERHAFPVDHWRAMIQQDENEPAIHGKGDTPLIAAMRCYVASKLGDEVDVPEELL